jgi:serine/threonine protein kinase
LIGSGGFGKVFKIRLDAAGESVTVAVKRVSEEHWATNCQEIIKCFQREVAVLSDPQYAHPNIVKLVGTSHNIQASWSEHPLCLIYEYMSVGSVEQLLTNKNQAYTIHRRLQSAIDIAQALTFLHEKQVTHRDIKPANIALDADWKAVLIDFGLAFVTSTSPPAQNLISMDSKLTHSRMNSRQGGGTSIYSCETFLRTNIYDCTSEVYSFGIVMFELFSGVLQEMLCKEDCGHQDWHSCNEPCPYDDHAGEATETFRSSFHKIAENCCKAKKKRIKEMSTVLAELKKISILASAQVHGVK